MVPITCAKKLFDIIQKPGVIGLKNGDNIEKINTVIIQQAPLTEVMNSLHNNKFFMETSCQN